jgi:type II secretory pathway pseudopilin PulG
MKFFFFTKKIISIRAFTLLETLLASAIIVSVILGPLTVAVHATTYAKETKDIMVATYLGEETIELLHNQYDSLYILCSKGDAPCDSLVAPETPSEASWRIFKAWLDGDGSNTSCFTANNASGCAYDFRDMTDNLLTSPVATSSKYSANPNNVINGTKCPKLSLVTGYVSGNLRNYYICSGVSEHTTYGDHPELYHVIKTTETAYSRKVKITSAPTLGEVGPFLAQKNDDLIITAIISIRKPTGVTRDIKVVDFIHSRP